MLILKPIIFSTLPLFILSFLLVYWAIKHGHISKDEPTANLKKFKKSYQSDKSNYSVNPIHKKWLFFGGGFYGLMAFITYFHVEVIQVYDFFSEYTSFSHLIEQITVSAVIGLIIDSFLNLIPAFTWFLYWPKHIVMENAIYWLIAAYLGYQLGTKFAQWWVTRYGFNLTWKNKVGNTD